MTQATDNPVAKAPFGAEQKSAAISVAASSIEVVVINLKRATERRQQMIAELADLKIPWSFFEAHTTLANPSLHYDESEYRHKYGEPLSVPQLACWSSHYTVIQTFLREGKSDYLLVLEDDVIYDVAFPLKKLISFCREKDIHFIRLFGMMYKPSTQVSLFFDRAVIRYKQGPCGTQAYLLSKEGAKRITENLTNIDMAVDVAMDRFWRTGLPIYAVFPFPIIERFSPSMIPIPRGGAVSPSSRLVRLAIRARNKFNRLLENRRLESRDRQMARSGWSFKQVDESDLL